MVAVVPGALKDTGGVSAAAAAACPPPRAAAPVPAMLGPGRALLGAEGPAGVAAAAARGARLGAAAAGAAAAAAPATAPAAAALGRAGGAQRGGHCPGPQGVGALRSHPAFIEQGRARALCAGATSSVMSQCPHGQQPGAGALVALLVVVTSLMRSVGLWRGAGTRTPVEVLVVVLVLPTLLLCGFWSLPQPRGFLTFTLVILSPIPWRGVSEELRGAELLAGLKPPPCSILGLPGLGTPTGASTANTSSTARTSSSAIIITSTTIIIILTRTTSTTSTAGTTRTAGTVSTAGTAIIVVIIIIAIIITSTTIIIILTRTTSTAGTTRTARTVSTAGTAIIVVIIIITTSTASSAPALLFSLPAPAAPFPSLSGVNYNSRSH
ncbi:uncharacterized protein LOC141917050 [Strix aluco]|uniref:uncharacterized protein LOC141917050 n=1 Tax=Strix aluco TaxID=111821 RepID=UPI003DA52BF7